MRDHPRFATVVFGMWIWLVRYCRISLEMEVVAIKMMVRGPGPLKKNREGVLLVSVPREGLQKALILFLRTLLKL